MRDHRKAEVVNEITALATRYSGTQQLREHMSGALLQYLAEQDRDTRHACAKTCDDEAKEIRREGAGSTNAQYEWMADGAERCAEALRSNE